MKNYDGINITRKILTSDEVFPDWEYVKQMKIEENELYKSMQREKATEHDEQFAIREYAALQRMEHYMKLYKEDKSRMNAMIVDYYLNRRLFSGFPRSLGVNIHNILGEEKIKTIKNDKNFNYKIKHDFDLIKMENYTRKRRRSHGFQTQREGILYRIELDHVRPFAEFEATLRFKNPNLSRKEKEDLLLGECYAYILNTNSKTIPQISKIASQKKKSDYTFNTQNSEKNSLIGNTFRMKDGTLTKVRTALHNLQYCVSVIKMKWWSDNQPRSFYCDNKDYKDILVKFFHNFEFRKGILKDVQKLKLVNKIMLRLYNHVYTKYEVSDKFSRLFEEDENIAMQGIKNLYSIKYSVNGLNKIIFSSIIETPNSKKEEKAKVQENFDIIITRRAQFIFKLGRVIEKLFKNKLLYIFKHAREENSLLTTINYMKANADKFGISYEKFKENVKVKLINNHITKDYDVKKTQIYRILDIDFNMSPLNTFTMHYRGQKPRDITYVEYYKDNYGYYVNNMQQPMVLAEELSNVHGGHHINKEKTYLVPELCHEVDNYAFDEVQNIIDSLKDQISSLGKYKPNKKIFYNNIAELGSTIKSNGNMQSFMSTNFERKFTQDPMSPMNLQQTSSTNSIETIKTDGSFIKKNNQFVYNRKLEYKNSLVNKVFYSADRQSEKHFKVIIPKSSVRSLIPSQSMFNFRNFKVYKAYSKNHNLQSKSFTNTPSGVVTPSKSPVLTRSKTFDNSDKYDSNKKNQIYTVDKYMGEEYNFTSQNGKISEEYVDSPEICPSSNAEDIEIRFKLELTDMKANSLKSLDDSFYAKDEINYQSPRNAPDELYKESITNHDQINYDDINLDDHINQNYNQNQNKSDQILIIDKEQDQFRKMSQDVDELTLIQADSAETQIFVESTRNSIDIQNLNDFTPENLNKPSEQMEMKSVKKIEDKQSNLKLMNILKDKNIQRNTNTNEPTKTNKNYDIGSLGLYQKIPKPAQFIIAKPDKDNIDNNPSNSLQPNKLVSSRSERNVAMSERIRINKFKQTGTVLKSKRKQMEDHYLNTKIENKRNKYHQKVDRKKYNIYFDPYNSNYFTYQGMKEKYNN